MAILCEIPREYSASKRLKFLQTTDNWGAVLLQPIQDKAQTFKDMNAQGKPSMLAGESHVVCKIISNGKHIASRDINLNVLHEEWTIAQCKIPFFVDSESKPIEDKPAKGAKVFLNPNLPIIINNGNLAVLPNNVD